MQAELLTASIFIEANAAGFSPNFGRYPVFALSHKCLYTDAKWIRIYYSIYFLRYFTNLDINKIGFESFIEYVIISYIKMFPILARKKKLSVWYDCTIHFVDLILETHQPENHLFHGRLISEIQITGLPQKKIKIKNKETRFGLHVFAACFKRASGGGGDLTKYKWY